MKQGALYVVGSGIKAVGHMTIEANGWVSQADRVLFLVGDKVMEKWIRDINVNAESLYGFYEEGKPRFQAYQKMIDKMLEGVRAGLKVCAVFYGHPGVFAYPSHKAIELARQEGYEAVMMPGISAEDCLFADLGIDPAKYGCQSFEATEFLVYSREIDPRVSLILWQIGTVGCQTYELDPSIANLGLSILVERLLKKYPSSHEVIIYEAAQYPLCKPNIQRLPLEELCENKNKFLFNSTLYIPPSERSVLDPEMVKQLGIDISLMSLKK